MQVATRIVHIAMYPLQPAITIMQIARAADGCCTRAWQTVPAGRGIVCACTKTEHRSVKNPRKLSLSEKISRLAVRLRDPEWRRYGGLLLAGKMMGAAL